MRYSAQRQVSHDLAGRGIVLSWFTIAFLKLLVKSVKLSYYMSPANNLAILNKNGEGSGVILTLIHWLEPPFFYCGVPNPC